MKILLILLMSLIGLLGAIKIFITWCFVTREKWEDFCNEALFLVRKEKIPILEDVLASGIFYDCYGREGITEDNWHLFWKIQYKFRRYTWKLPQMLYNIFKRELCGDLPIKWKQALQEANILKLENLNK